MRLTNYEKSMRIISCTYMFPFFGTFSDEEDGNVIEVLANQPIEGQKHVKSNTQLGGSKLIP